MKKIIVLIIFLIIFISACVPPTPFIEKKVCGFEQCRDPSSRCDWVTRDSNPVCPAIFFPENICHQFLKCAVNGSSCNTVEDPRYKECMNCFETGDKQECHDKYLKCGALKPPATCDMLFKGGYYFNAETNTCEYTESGLSPCNEPFGTQTECQSVCGAPQKDSRCKISDFGGACRMIVNPGYYFDSIANQCEYYKGSNHGCDQPPFATSEECQSVCGGEIDPATLCDDVVCPEGQACFEGGCIPTEDIQCEPFDPTDDECENIDIGYYVSSITGKCEYNSAGSCRTIPFNTLADCQQVCGGSAPTDDEQTLCQKSRGTWREFSNGCADFCGLSIEDPCPMMLTDNCDCGISKCWNGKSCEMN